jgi:hypothetical protein
LKHEIQAIHILYKKKGLLKNTSLDLQKQISLLFFFVLFRRDSSQSKLPEEVPIKYHIYFLDISRKSQSEILLPLLSPGETRNKPENAQPEIMPKKEIPAYPHLNL